MFYFIEKCSLYNYADDNSLSISAPTVDEVVLNLKHDCEISLRWYKQNGMEANPNKFQFLISSPYTAENMELKLKIDENITLALEPFVKLLVWVYTLIVTLLLLTMSARAAKKLTDN